MHNHSEQYYHGNTPSIRAPFGAVSLLRRDRDEEEDLENNVMTEVAALKNSERTFRIGILFFSSIKNSHLTYNFLVPCLVGG